jgi:hypothetical protein
LFELTDRNKCSLPCFVAKNLFRIPPFVPDATDFCTLAASVELLHGQMADVMKLSTISGRSSSAADPVISTDDRSSSNFVAQSTVHQPLSSSLPAVDLSLTGANTSGPCSYAEVAVRHVSTAFATGRSGGKPPVRILGTWPVTDSTGESTSGKAIQKRISAFVGRWQTFYERLVY